MTKQEIIEVTLQKIEYKRNPPPDEIADCVGIEGYDDFVIAELFEQLPQGEIRTCEDFEYLNVECCEICHRYYPHFDMRLETLSDGSKAWICCQVRSALLDPEARVAELPEYVDMESVFAALLPNVGIVFVHAGCLWVDSTPVDDAKVCLDVQNNSEFVLRDFAVNIFIEPLPATNGVVDIDAALLSPGTATMKPARLLERGEQDWLCGDTPNPLPNPIPSGDIWGFKVQSAKGWRQ